MEAPRHAFSSVRRLPWVALAATALGAMLVAGTGCTTMQVVRMTPDRMPPGRTLGPAEVIVHDQKGGVTRYPWPSTVERDATKPVVTVVRAKPHPSASGREVELLSKPYAATSLLSVDLREPPPAQHTGMSVLTGVELGLRDLPPTLTLGTEPGNYLPGGAWMPTLSLVLYHANGSPNDLTWTATFGKLGAYPSTAGLVQTIDLYGSRFVYAYRRPFQLGAWEIGAGGDLSVVNDFYHDTTHPGSQEASSVLVGVPVFGGVFFQPARNVEVGLKVGGLLTLDVGRFSKNLSAFSLAPLASVSLEVPLNPLTPFSDASMPPVSLSQRRGELLGTEGVAALSILAGVLLQTLPADAHDGTVHSVDLWPYVAYAFGVGAAALGFVP